MSKRRFLLVGVASKDIHEGDRVWFETKDMLNEHMIKREGVFEYDAEERCFMVRTDVLKYSPREIRNVRLKPRTACRDLPTLLRLVASKDIDCTKLDFHVHRTPLEVNRVEVLYDSYVLFESDITRDELLKLLFPGSVQTVCKSF